MKEPVYDCHYNAPYFSIIVPVYNTEVTFFSECLNSLIHQSFSNIEIIVIDDGSSSQYAKAYDELIANNERVKTLHKQNEGVSVARNTGIAMSRAGWIMFVDADDWLETDACEKLYNVLLKKQCDILLFNHVVEYRSGNHRVPKTGLSENKIYHMSDPVTKESFYCRAMGTPNTGKETLSIIYYSWDKVFSHRFLSQNLLEFPKGLPKSEDKVFILQCFEKMDTLMYLNEALYHYRINEQRVSNIYSQNVDEERKELFSYLEEIAVRMDEELGTIKRESQYCTVYNTYMRFVFGIVSDVLFSKYYHNDYPKSKKQRRIEVKEFLKSHPINTAIAFCKYRELGWEAKIKKFMLTHGLTTLFCAAKKIKRQVLGRLRQ